jgi:pseudaminic acid synthase
MKKFFEIDSVSIGLNHPPYVIAEMSANHNGSLENAMALIRQAKLAGASAVKMQTYTPETMTLDCEGDQFRIKDGLWVDRTLFDLYREAHTPWSWHGPLFEYAKKIGITIFSSPFDSTAVDFLEDLNAPAYKIASFEAVDLPLIRYVAATRKPMIISTGMASLDEIGEAIEAAHDGGCEEVAILRCVSGYPAPASDYNLRTIPDMASRFGLVTGLSDHTLDNSTAIAAVALGASIIEKHFTLNRNGGGPDDSFSLEPDELLSLCQSTKSAWEALGTVHYGHKSSEKANVKFRRSLYFVKDLKQGDIVTADAVKSIRPGFGLPPRELDNLIGRTATMEIRRGTPASFELVTPK